MVGFHGRDGRAGNRGGNGASDLRSRPEDNRLSCGDGNRDCCPDRNGQSDLRDGGQSGRRSNRQSSGPDCEESNGQNSGADSLENDTPGNGRSNLDCNSGDGPGDDGGDFAQGQLAHYPEGTYGRERLDNDMA